MWRCLRRIQHKLQRRRLRGGAKSNIRKPATAFNLNSQQHMRQTGFHLGGDLPAHAGNQRRDVKAHLLQNRQKQRVVLEAITTASAVNQLVHNSLQIQGHTVSPVGRNVLKRDRLRVQQMQLLQHFQARFHRPLIADTGKVRIKKSRCRNGSHLTPQKIAIMKNGSLLHLFIQVKRPPKAVLHPASQVCHPTDTPLPAKRQTLVAQALC